MRVIDLLHLGRGRVIGAWLVDDVIIDCGPASSLPVLLGALGDEPPRALLLTHIHLDHAGAAGSLVRRWPQLRVYVHERGVRHLVDPTRLYESAARLYGSENMERLWGDVLPVPEANIEVLRGGERIHSGRFEVIYTPGHASHHVAFRDGGTAFVGDVAGVRITPSGITLPPTPPPDVDVEAWHESIAKVRAWSPERLAITHFGCSEDVSGQLSALERRLEAWSELAREVDQDTYIRTVRGEIADQEGSDQAATYEQAMPFEQGYVGLRRYWSKRVQS